MTQNVFTNYSLTNPNNVNKYNKTANYITQQQQQNTNLHLVPLVVNQVISIHALQKRDAL